MLNACRCIISHYTPFTVEIKKTDFFSVAFCYKFIVNLRTSNRQDELEKSIDGAWKC